MFASRAAVGVFGLGDVAVTPSGPVQQDITTYYQAGLIVGAGGTSPLDMSNSTADEQAAFTSGFNAGSAPVTLAQTTGAAGAGGGTSSTTPAPAAATTPVVSNAIVLGGLGIAAIFLIAAMLKR